MLYEMVAIARYAGVKGVDDAREVCRLVGKMVVNNRGVVRNIQNWGLRPLPKIVNKDRQSHIVGAHFYMKFDSSPAVQREVLRSLRSDPRIVRSMIVKNGGDT
uniref:ARAD1C35706p n=1 Tax=Blastobotrys adeninivorans TaxID=409370 RepID=A0A060T8C3_BLAAD